MRLLAVAALATLAAAAPAAAAAAAPVAWMPVRGTISGEPIDATRTGSSVHVLSSTAAGLTVSRVAGGRVMGRRVVPATRPRRPRLVAAGGGSLVVVWSTNGAILAARAPSPGARFGPPRTISVHPGGTGAAAAPSVAVSPDGRVLVAWWGGPAGGRLGIHASELSGRGVWSAPVDVTGGTYPQARLGSYPVGVTAAASPDGGWAVAWSHLTSPPPLENAFALEAARRAAGGPWQAPVVLAPVFAARPVIAAGAGGEVTTAWTEGRDPRPDGVAATACLVAARLAGQTVTRQELGCRTIGPLYVFPGALLSATPAGGTVAAWNDPGAYTALTFARAPGADAWSGPALAAAPTHGVPFTLALTPVTGGRTLLVTQAGESVPARFTGFVRPVLLRPDGSVIGRAPGPATPGRPRSFIPTYRTIGPSSPQGLVAWTDGRTNPARYRLSLLRVSP